MKRLSCLLFSLLFFACLCLHGAGVPSSIIACEGSYPGHLQGIDTDGTFIYWSFTTVLVKTDLSGKVVVRQGVVSHHGDLCVHEGKVYVAVNRGRFNQEQGAISEVWVYEGKNLTLLRKHQVPELVHGAGGMTWHHGSFYVVGGLPKTHTQNYVYEYTPEFVFVKRHDLLSGYTVLGIQTVAFMNDRFWFGVYGSRDHVGLIRTDSSFQQLETFRANGSVGLMSLQGTVYCAFTKRVGNKSWTGHVRPMRKDLQK